MSEVKEAPGLPPGPSRDKTASAVTFWKFAPSSDWKSLPSPHASFPLASSAAEALMGEMPGQCGRAQAERPSVPVLGSGGVGEPASPLAQVSADGRMFLSSYVRLLLSSLSLRRHSFPHSPLYSAQQTCADPLDQQ